MKNSLTQLYRRNSKIVTGILIIPGVVFLISSIFNRDYDYFLNMKFAYTACTFFILALIHPWRKTKNFIHLMIYSAIGFPTILMFGGAAAFLIQKVTDNTVIIIFIEVIGFSLLNIALIVCPIAFLTGFIGTILVGHFVKKQV